MAKKLHMDWLLFSVAAALAIFGVVMVYSASAMISLQETRNSPSGPTDLAYVHKQAILTLVGIVLMWIFARVDYHVFQRKTLVYALVILTIILLSLVYGFEPINGARRWIKLAGMSFQPSELAKLSLPVFLAWYFTEKSPDRFKNLLTPICILGVLSGLILFEPDLGTTIVLCAIFGFVYFLAGARWLHLVFLLFPIISVFLILLMISPWRVRRLMAFLSPCSDEHAYDAGYQVCQSLYAIGSGGLLGEGFAKGQQKLFYLPYPYSDFIFAVVGEELGLLGTTFVILAFAFFLWRGMRAAMFAPDRFGNLLATGIVTGIITQALFNISVTISLLPAKGIPLPFISYGGSSIMVTLISVGVLLSISQHSNIATVKRRTKEKRKLSKSADLKMKLASRPGVHSWHSERRSQG